MRVRSRLPLLVWCAKRLVVNCCSIAEVFAGGGFFRFYSGHSDASCCGGNDDVYGCGWYRSSGSLRDRAERLLSVKNLKPEQYPKKLLAPKSDAGAGAGDAAAGAAAAATPAAAGSAAAAKESTPAYATGIPGVHGRSIRLHGTTHPLLYSVFPIRHATRTTTFLSPVAGWRVVVVPRFISCDARACGGRDQV